MSMYAFVDLIFQALQIVLFIRVLLSWIPHDPYNQFIAIIYRISEPILAPFRQLIPPISGIDISIIVAFIALELVRNIILRTLVF